MSHFGDALSRRRFLGASAVAWLPIGALLPGEVAGDPPPAFPAGVDLYRQAYQNWAGEIRTDDLWTCSPRTPADVVLLANWAHSQGFTLRPRGFRHGWSPLTVTADTTGADRVVLVDTTRHLTAMTVLPDAVRVQTGASMDDLLAFLEDAGLGVTNTPAPGDLSVGGVLAINGHGTSVPAVGETRPPGHTYGSLSNMIISLTAVVWDGGEYRLRTFRRDEPECAALLTHVGRAFLTEVTLRVGANQNLRCVSRADIPTSELFAPPGSGATRTFASFLDQAGRVEAIWFVFTDRPWLKTWSVAPTKPPTSRHVVAPYNYLFSDNVPKPVSDLADLLITGAWALTPTFGQLQYTTAATGLTATLTTDLWGASKNLLLYVKPTTLRETANGYAVLTSRAEVQRVVSDFAAFYEDLLLSYKRRGLFPVTGQVEIRVGGLDDPAHVGVPGAQVPALSAVRPREDHPEWDVAVWFDVLTFPTAPGAAAFYRELEQFFFTRYSGAYASTRAEWSKGWAYTDEAAWADHTMLTSTVPDTYRQGPNASWDAARATLNAFDPHRVFSNPFLDVLLP
ncbi:FAD-linked oxidase [Saccharothrix sp. NRRL B-16348]|uniref:cholesterol oxidase substrate-binding domain-containing protein n=1 Tax=Saccharothrix sp. NRRL B-16348 TaxID=1415542 RepID=UPI0006B0068B|nr:cholesterol oxidase substrate-binding domain-containing protein [Saccharothrix sp. NRRL B-16348]KOX20475.1 FAD-linked oxidase [Saccharothrix sp. NRRL B-16348]